ncbi:MAG TPA: hypothetical protein VFV83_08455, partial [Chthoniobacteraceae bacterium]|nr:hypothetical protein [Chthoniobacteraceae bacterium]
MIGLALSGPAWIAGWRLSARHGPSRQIETHTVAAEVAARPGTERELRPEQERKDNTFNSAEWREAIAHWKKIRSVTRQRVGIFDLARDLDIEDFPAAMLALETEKATREDAALTIRARMSLFEIWADRDLTSA